MHVHTLPVFLKCSTRYDKGEFTRAHPALSELLGPFDSLRIMTTRVACRQVHLEMTIRGVDRNAAFETTISGSPLESFSLQLFDRTVWVWWGDHHDHRGNLQIFFSDCEPVYAPA